LNQTTLPRSFIYSAHDGLLSTKYFVDNSSCKLFTTIFVDNHVRRLFVDNYLCLPFIDNIRRYFIYET